MTLMSKLKSVLDRHQKLRFFVKNIFGKGIIKNYYNTTYEKNCLMMYMIYPFKRPELDNFHQANWQEKQIAKMLSKRGYNIDIIDYNNTSIKLKNKYDLIIDLIPGKNPVFKKHMKEGCKTIAYLTGSNATFQNAAEKSRLADLEKRRGVALTPRRQSPYLTKDIENYTACFMIGNAYNWRTYDEFNLAPPYYIKNTGHIQKYIFNKSIKKKNYFLYFGSIGQVHKGLDLLLEVFSTMDSDCELFVCGLFEQEKDFTDEYKDILYKNPRIHAIGFVSVGSQQFDELTSVCTFSILPSCSEANAGAVLTSMSAGLIPICSYECGFEDDEVIHLKDCSIDTIRETILEYSQKDDEWIIQESRHAYDIVQKRYSKQNFIDSINYALEHVLNDSI